MKNNQPFRKVNFMFLVVLFFLGGAACHKQVVAPEGRAPKTSTSLTAGGPPSIIAWLRGTDIPVSFDLASTFVGRVSPFSFAIGGKGYVGAGIDFTNNSQAKIEVPGTDVWQFDTSTHGWTQVADWPGAAHTHMANFVIGTRGYVCTGATDPDFSNPNLRVREVWQYDQPTNIWTRKSNFPGGARSGAVGIAINGKGYLGTGTTASNEGNQDWWQYDPLADEWAQKASMPGPRRTEAVAFAPPNASGKVYVSTGFETEPTGNIFNDLWEYTPSTNSWAQKPSLPAAPRGEAVGISLPTTGVVSTGIQGSCPTCGLNDCWEFNPATGAWFQLPNVGGGARLDAGSFCIGNIIYIGAGRGAGSILTSSKTDFWGLDLN
jgi:hypothetical protein